MTIKTTPRSRATTAVLLLVALAATACNAGATADDPGALGPPPTAPAPTEPDPVPPSLDPISIDWPGPTVTPTTLPNGWLVAACDGTVPVLCVTDGDELVGVVESGRWTPDDPVTDADAFLRSELEDHLATFAVDRVATCGDGYRFELAGPATTVTVGGHPGLTYATRGSAESGDVHERGLATTVVAGDEVVWISAVATAPDGCMAADLRGEFTPADLETFAPWFDALIRGTTFDASTAGAAGGA